MGLFSGVLIYLFIYINYIYIYFLGGFIIVIVWYHANLYTAQEVQKSYK